MNKKAKSETNSAVSAANGAAGAAPARKPRTAKAKPAATAGAKAVRTRKKAAPAAPQASTLDLAALQQEIARQAYLYWEERGRQGGSELEDWLRAEAEVKQRLTAAP